MRLALLGINFFSVFFCFFLSPDFHELWHSVPPLIYLTPTVVILLVHHQSFIYMGRKSSIDNVINTFQ